MECGKRGFGKEGGGCTRVKWVPFVLLAFSPLFYSSFCFKIGHFPFKNVVFWELEEAIFGPEKDKWWIWGSNTPKPPEMPTKPGKTSQHHNWPRYMDWPQIGPTVAIKQGKKRQKDKWYPFRAPTGGGAGGCWKPLSLHFCQPFSITSENTSEPHPKSWRS